MFRNDNPGRNHFNFAINSVFNKSGGNDGYMPPIGNFLLLDNSDFLLLGGGNFLLLG